MRLGNGNESDSSAPTIRLATLIRGARTAAGGERARILGVGASTAASTPGDFLGSARGRHLICARAHLLQRLSIKVCFNAGTLLLMGIGVTRER